MNDVIQQTMSDITTNDTDQALDFSTDTTTCHRVNLQKVDNVLVIWLGNNIDENNENYRNMISQLRSIVNNIIIFTDSDQCIQFMNTITNIKVCLIISGSLEQYILPRVHSMSQIDSIFIMYEEKIQDIQWVKDWSKIKGVFADISPICEALKQVVPLCEQNAMSITFLAMNTDDDISKKWNQLDTSFIYTYALTEILLSINFEDKHIKEFIDYCRNIFIDNTCKLNNIMIFEQTYSEKTPIWWYTYEGFLQSMLSRALRLLDVDILIRMGFFIRDIHRHIQQLHSEQIKTTDSNKSFTVYRGQGLSIADVEKMIKAKNGLISFNNFLSTSKSRSNALRFALEAAKNPDLVGILFIMDIDSSQSTTCFASITDVSYQHDENDILFSMHTIFRIVDIKSMDEHNRRYEIKLTLTSDNDKDLTLLTDRIRDETYSNSTGWHELAEILLKMGEYTKVEAIYEMLYEETTDESKRAYIYHQLGFAKDEQGTYQEAIVYYEKSIDIKEKILPSNHLSLATSYNNIGQTFYHMADYSKALLFFEKALEIRLQALPENHSGITDCYQNIGLVHYNMGDYMKALSCIEKALEVQKTSLLHNHPDLAYYYNNIGEIYRKMGEYPKALSFHEKALEIRQQSLSSNHLDLSMSYNNIGMIHYNTGDYLNAISSLEKSLKIRQQSLPSIHLQLAYSYNNLGATYYHIGDYEKALPMYQKALEIRQQALPAHHVDLCASYNNVGIVYYILGDFMKALSSYEKALEIRQQSLLSNHLDLASSYNNIGGACCGIGDYSKALLYHKKALEIRQEILSPNHPDFSVSFNNIGMTYYHMGDYSKAFPCCQRAVDIGQRSLPADDTDLLVSMTNLENIRMKL
ncbi:unnamed protein product [Adineta steineri]|uniref:Uncharacterized protein n=1 Tax=Adineta steineri TaxID=433720 RepID=A0A818H4T8_9BILA|nr:unnamed protein product [Adineta steineri]